MLKFLKSNLWLLILLLTTLIIFLFLIRINYFRQAIDLEYLLPNKTLLIASLDLSELNATINQKNKLAGNQFIKGFINQAISFVQTYLDNYQLNWVDLQSKYFDPKGIFFIAEEGSIPQWGFIIKANNKRVNRMLQEKNLLLTNDSYQNFNIFEITAPNNPPLYLTFINDRILTISSSITLNKKIINQYINKTDSSWQRSFSIINLKPILTIKLSPQLSSLASQYEPIAELYKIITPLIIDEAREFTIEFNQPGNYLHWQIINFKPLQSDVIYNQYDISGLLTQIKFKPLLIAGSYQPYKIASKSATVQNEIFNYINKLTANYYQLDLANQIIKRLTRPTILSLFDEETFFIITSDQQLDVIENIIINTLSNFSPQEVTKTLPDGTPYIELVADKDRVASRTSLINKKDIKTFFIPNNNISFSYYQNNGYLIASNNYSALLDNLNSINDLSILCLYDQSFAELIYLALDDEFWQNNDYLQANFKEIKEVTIIDQTYQGNIVLKGCLKLK